MLSRSKKTVDNKPKKSRKWIWISLSVIVIVIVGLLFYWSKGITNALDSYNKDPEESIFKNIEPEEVVETPTWEGKERVNILLMGVDSRDADANGIARSDSMLVASIDPVTKKAHLFSVLRDTYVPIGRSHGRINSAITIGAPPLAMKTVGDLLGLEIQYYVYTDFEGFKALVDSLGGIYFDVEKDMRYRSKADNHQYDIDLKKGYQLLDGDKALQYVRFRHDALSDYTRTERQRNFLKAVASEVQSGWNLIRLKEILESVTPYIETNLQVSDMVKLGWLAIGSKVGGTAQIPPMNLLREETRNGSSVIVVSDMDALHKYVQEVLSETDTEADPAANGDNDAQNEANGSGSSAGASASPN